MHLQDGHVCLLSTRNLAFARLLTQILWLQAQFLDYAIKTICLDNASEFRSQISNDYSMLVGITIEHPIARLHLQNGLSESFIKHPQLIGRPLLMRIELLVFV